VSTPPGWADPNPAPTVNPRTPAVLTITAVVATLVVLATLVAVVVSARHIAFTRTPQVASIELSAVGSDVLDPFAESIATPPPRVSAAAAEHISTMIAGLPSDPDRGVRVVSGGRAGLYGGITQQSPCAAAALASTLGSHPERARSWATASTILARQIPAYLNTLTPVSLTADTWVTAYRYSSRQGLPFQTVLQAGTAVLIDRAGVPRVHCASGDPLAPPPRTSLAAFVQEGHAWPGYSPQDVVAIAYTEAGSSFTDPPPTAPISEFALVNLADGGPLIRRSGDTIDLSGTEDPALPLPDPIAKNAPS
jgi:hypothetical protein